MNDAIGRLQQILLEHAGVFPDESEPLFAMTRAVTLEAKEQYIRKGDTSRKLAYIQQGIMRAYTIKDDGSDATLFVRREGDFIASHETIIYRQPSRFVYLALESTTLIEIDYDVLEDVLRKNPKYEPLRNFFLMSMLAEALNHIESFVTQSPEERYRNLVAEDLGLVNRVPDKHIASMLGITPVSLSRIRKRMHNK